MEEFRSIVGWLAAGAGLVFVTIFMGRFCAMSSDSPPGSLGAQARARKEALDAQRAADKEESANCGYIRPGEWQCNCKTPPCKVRPHERTADRHAPGAQIGRRAAIEATKAKREARNAT